MHNKIGWTLPGIYTFCIHAMLMTHTPNEVVEQIHQALAAEQKLLEDLE